MNHKNNDNCSENLKQNKIIKITKISANEWKIIINEN